jgi:hypothetical protein
VARVIAEEYNTARPGRATHVRDVAPNKYAVAVTSYMTRRRNEQMTAEARAALLTKANAANPRLKKNAAA